MPTLYDNFERVKNFIDENNTSYVSKTELANASYVTQTSLSGNSYVTQTSLSGMGYVTSAAVPAIDGNIIPKTTTTYTLGDEYHLYSSVNTGNIYFSEMGNAGRQHIIGRTTTNNSQAIYTTVLNNAGSSSNTFTVGLNDIHCTNGKNLGTSSNKFGYAYINNLILNGNNIINTINGMFSYDTSTGTLTITTI